MKTISIPTSKGAERRLDVGEESRNDLFELHLSKDDFNLLFSSGWVKEINAVTGSNIDEHEDDRITGPYDLTKVRDISQSYSSSHQNKVFSDIATLSQKALEGTREFISSFSITSSGPN